MQPDVGMSILIVITWSFQIFLAGMPLAIVILLVGIVAPVSLYSAYTFLPHVADRIEKFMAGGGMQAKYAMRSFANGGLFGVGPGEVSSNITCLMPMLILSLPLPVRSSA